MGWPKPRPTSQTASKGRANAAQHIKSDTREQPKPLEPLEDDPRVRVICPPDGLILFSAAQLHETVPNTAGVARYSIDFRTVHVDDVLNRRGAPNVDSRCTGTSMRDYLRGSDLARLPEDVVKTYDDGTEVMAPMLVFPPTSTRVTVGA